MKLNALAFALCFLTLLTSAVLGVDDLSEEELLSPSPFATKVLTWEDVPEYTELM